MVHFESDNSHDSRILPGSWNYLGDTVPRMHKAMEQMFRSALPVSSDTEDPPVILELGSGTSGELKDILADVVPGMTYISSDHSSEALLKRTGGNELQIVSDAAHIPLPQESVDGVVLFKVAHELTRGEQARLWKEVARILKPGASAVVELDVFHDSTLPELGASRVMLATLKDLTAHGMPFDALAEAALSLFENPAQLRELLSAFGYPNGQDELLEDTRTLMQMTNQKPDYLNFRDAEKVANVLFHAKGLIIPLLNGQKTGFIEKLLPLVAERHIARHNLYQVEHRWFGAADEGEHGVYPLIREAGLRFDSAHGFHTAYAVTPEQITEGEAKKDERGVVIPAYHTLQVSALKAYMKSVAMTRDGSLTHVGVFCGLKDTRTGNFQILMPAVVLTLTKPE